MAKEFLVGKECTPAAGQENHFIRVNVGQSVERLELPHRRVLFPIVILGPELGIERSAIRGKRYTDLVHALHQATTADGLVVGMGHNDQSIFQQRSQSSHYQSRMADSRDGFAPNR